MAEAAAGIAAFAAAFIDEAYPAAAAVFAGGSRVEARATATSDLDLVVVTDDPEAPFRATHRFDGVAIEVFAHSEESLRSWALREAAAERRSPLLRMCARGVLVRDLSGVGAAVQDEFRSVYEAGPRPLTEEDVAWRRYLLTDMRDDLEAPHSAAEAAITAAHLAVLLANFACEQRRWWTGTGKWALRHLTECAPELARELDQALHASGRGDHTPLLTLTDSVLASAGGRLQEGFTQSGKARNV